MIKLAKSGGRFIHGVGLSHATPGGGPVLRRELGGPPWWRHINGVWWTWSGKSYWLTFRRH